MSTPPRSFPAPGPSAWYPGDASGRPAPHDGWPVGLPAPRLWRSRSNRVVAGVIGGLAEKLGLEAKPLRIIYALFAAFSGGSLLVPYVAIWSITRTSGPPRRGPRLWRSRSQVAVAGVLGGLAEKLGISATTARVSFVVLSVLRGLFPGLLTYLGLWAVTRPFDPAWVQEP